MHRHEQYRKKVLPFALAIGLVLGLAPLIGHAQAAAASDSGATHQPLLLLGPGDQVTVHVFGQPNMDGSVYVADDGTVQVPLVGPVHVAGLSPTDAAHAVEAALRQQQILVDPHVTLTIDKTRSQKVSVLGQVIKSGDYAITSNTTLLELLAEAGGETPLGGDTIYIWRAGPDGVRHRMVVNLAQLTETGATPDAAEITMRGGDQIIVPRAGKVFVTGEVHSPGEFKLEPDMTVLEALAHAGGVTNMGSTHRIIIRRQQPDGKYRQISARLTDRIQANDVVTVRERIF